MLRFPERISNMSYLAAVQLADVQRRSQPMWEFEVCPVRLLKQKMIEWSVQQ